MPEPNDITLKPDQAGDRTGVTDAEIEAKIEGYLFPAKNGMVHRYFDIRLELEDMAAGGGDPNTRSQFYPGWTDEDFQKVLKRLDEEEVKLGLS